MDKALTDKDLDNKSFETVSDSGRRTQPPVLENLYKQHWAELCNFLRRRFGGGPPEPEDVAQAAFAKIAELENPAEIENPRAFLFRIARNIVIDQIRRNTTRDKFVSEEQVLAQSLDEETSADFEVERVLINEQEATRLKQILQRLDEREREFLLLHRLHGLSYTEIARRSGMSRNGVKAVIKRVFAACEAAMEQSDEY